MSLCGVAFSGEDIPLSTIIVFIELTETIAWLSKREIDALSNAICELDGSLEEEEDGILALVEDKIHQVLSKVYE